MGSLLHPVGPQPAQVYWLRRGALVLGVVAVVAALAFVFRPQPQVPVTAVPASPSVSAAPTVAATASTSPSPSASPTATGPLACDATNTTLGLAGYKKVKQDAKQPFSLTITNTGKQSCVLDLKPATFSLAVTSGTDRIWTTDHCDKWVPATKRTLKAGKAHEFTITWGVVRSGEGCKTAKSLLGTGTYVASATFAETSKARAVFLVTKAG